MPTQTKENYLKAIFAISERSESITISKLAQTMGVSKPTVNSMVKKLKENKWISYEKYKPLKMTPRGKKVAAMIVRKHRLAEMFLTNIMNFGWEEVHDIAEEMEHIQSESFFDRMDEILGFPTQDPHGSPIPDKLGRLVKPDLINLSILNIGDRVKLCGLTNSSKELLLYLNKKNMQLGTEFKVSELEEFDKSMEVTFNNGSAIVLSQDVCQCLLVELC